ncbi:MAG: hypothetical protein OXU61_08950 [Gammaproteobacteria bacterium]|nr:hypothetical protein [Gammaproteobacteria bacterium]
MSGCLACVQYETGPGVDAYGEHYGKIRAQRQSAYGPRHSRAGGCGLCGRRGQGGALGAAGAVAAPPPRHSGPFPAIPGFFSVIPAQSLPLA